MATEILHVASTPSSYAPGGFPLSILQSGPSWGLTATPNVPSTDVQFTSSDRAVLATNTNGGLYFGVVSGGLRISLYNGSGSGTLVVMSDIISFLSGAAIRIALRLAAGTNASSLTVSGAATGNGQTLFTTSGTYFDNSILGVGQFTNSNTYVFPGQISSIDDDQNAALAACTSATSASVVARAVVAAVAACSCGASASVQGTTPADSVCSSTATALAVARVITTGSAAASSSASAALPGAFGLGVSSSAVAWFGQSPTSLTIPGGAPTSGGGTVDPDGRAIVPYAPQNDSTLYVFVGRPKSAVKTCSDNRGNSYTQLSVDDYVPSSSWETAIFEAKSVVGGSGTVLTLPSVLFDEITGGVTEIVRGYVRHAFSTVFRSAATTLTSQTIACTGPAIVFFDWAGEGPVESVEGVELSVVPTDPSWTRVDGRLKNHTGGWIQWVRFAKFFSVATSGISITVSQGRSEGARFYGAVYQENEYVVVDASAAASSSATASSVARVVASADSTGQSGATVPSVSRAVVSATSTAASSATASVGAGVAASSTCSSVAIASSEARVLSAGSATTASTTAASVVSRSQSVATSQILSQTVAEVVAGSVSPGSATCASSATAEVTFQGATPANSVASSGASCEVVTRTLVAGLSTVSSAALATVQGGQVPPIFSGGSFVSNDMRTRHLEMVRGSTYRVKSISREDSCRARDLTGSVVYVAIRADMKIGPSVRLTSANPPPAGWRTGVVVANQQQERGGYEWTLIPSDTRDLVAMGHDDPWVYDVAIVMPDGEVVRDVATSNLDIYPQVTEIP